MPCFFFKQGGKSRQTYCTWKCPPPPPPRIPLPPNKCWICIREKNVCGVKTFYPLGGKTNYRDFPIRRIGVPNLRGFWATSMWQNLYWCLCCMEPSINISTEYYYKNWTWNTIMYLLCLSWKWLEGNRNAMSWRKYSFSPGNSPSSRCWERTNFHLWRMPTAPLKTHQTPRAKPWWTFITDTS